MNKSRSLLLVALSMVLIPSPAGARAERSRSLEAEIGSRFPLAARVSGLSATPAAFRHADALCEEAFPIATASGFLRPVSSRVPDGTEETRGIAYRGLFRDADLFSIRTRDADLNLLVLRDSEAGAGVGFEVTAPAGVHPVLDERGIRFLSDASTSTADAVLGAPLIVDATGRPSTNVRWTLTATDARSHAAIARLSIADSALVYPLVVLYTYGRPQKSVSALIGQSAHLTPVTNANGSLSGTVREFGTGVPLSGQIVDVLTAAGEYADFGITDANGVYRVSLPAGSYRAYLSAFGYQPQLFNGISCLGGCDITQGTAITVTDGVNTPNIDFALRRNGSHVSGRVTDTSNLALGDVDVLLYDSAGSPAAIGHSNSDDGTFDIALNAGGTFFAATRNATHAGYVDQLYSNKPCSGCNPTTGTPINISLGSDVSGVNFVLPANGGQISGTITDGVSGRPIAGAVVTVFSSAGRRAAFAESDTVGNYVSFNGLVAGNYFVEVTAFGYRTERFDNVACAAACSPTSGTPVAVAAGSMTSNVNFALNTTQARVSGRVTDAATGGALGGVLVVFENSSGIVKAQHSGGDGSYDITLPGAGTYFARVENDVFEGYLDQVYSNFDCTTCRASDGSPINVEIGTPVLNVNFALHRGGTISGRVTDGGTGAPIAFAYVEIYNSTGAVVSHGISGSDGLYSSTNGLATGDYFAAAYSGDLQPELFSEIGCAATCNATAGTIIHVTTGQNTPSIDFTLGAALGRASGRVLDASTSLPVAGVTIGFYDATGVLVGSAQTDDSGNYLIGVATQGTYFARTLITDGSYADQLYNGKPCNNCDPTTGTPIAITVGATTPNIDFFLAPSPCSSVVFTPELLPAGQVGVPYSATISVTGGEQPMTLSAQGTIPPGLSFAPSTGTLSGTPAAGGAYFVEIVATSSVCTISRIYEIDINATQSTTTLTVSPSVVTFGTPVLLTAQVNPADAEGGLTFTEGTTILGSASIIAGGSASLTVSLASGVHNLTAQYSGSSTYNPSVSNTVQIVVQKATPVVTWAAPAPIVYGTALSSAQLNATASVPGTFTYTPGAGTILDAGSQVLNVLFTPADADNYNSATGSTTLLVNRASQVITWATPADIVYGTLLSTTQLNATVSVPGPSPAGALTYSPAAGMLLTAGSHILSVTAAATPNYNSATAQVTLNVLKATPAFSNLTSPTIVVGTSSAVIGGSISLGTLIPTGTVLITFNGVSLAAAVQTDGSFNATFATNALVPIGTGYVVNYQYSGDSNFFGASATSVLIVSYGTRGGSVNQGPGSGSSSIPFRITLIDATGRNLSSASIQVMAYGVQLDETTQWLPAPSTGNNGSEFTFQNAAGGSYNFILKTTGLVPGSYVLGFTVQDDPVIHTTPFKIQ